MKKRQASGIEDISKNVTKAFITSRWGVGMQLFPQKDQATLKQTKETSSMDCFKGDETLSSSLKWGFNQSASPLHTSFSRNKDDTWLLHEAKLNPSPSVHPTNSLLFDSSAAFAHSSKAVFTISLPKTQILMVNSVACKLLGFAAEELCATSLKALIPDPLDLSYVIDKTSSSQLNAEAFTTGSVVELSVHDGTCLPVFIFFKRVDNPERCVAIAELVDRRTATMHLDNFEKIKSFDDEIATIFQYEDAELVGALLTDVIPSACLGPLQENSGRLQYVTGRTKRGAHFPLCVSRRQRPEADDDGHLLVLQIYSNLTGAILIRNDLTIANCNHLFSTLLFGFSKDSLVNCSISKILPTFCEDGDYGRERTMTADGDNSDDSDFVTVPTSAGRNISRFSPPELSTSFSKPATADASTQDCAILVADLSLDSGAEDDSSIAVIKESDLALQSEMTEKLTILNGNYKETKQSHTRIRASRSDDVLAKTTMSSSNNSAGSHSHSLLPAATSNLNLNGTGLQAFPMNRVVNVTNLSDVEAEGKHRVVEGSFAGRGRHRNGADIDVVYRVRAARGHAGYLVYIARDPWEAAEGGRRMPPNLTVTCSFNSTSLESNFPKDCDSRPNSASLISQSDDVLTSGDYSDYYTNLQQIGKGAFGYVKMAYRNDDGMLVITKFIKKNKIHVRSWVLDPTLDMKVPLEISLLTTLDHPHIVRVLDVFHNDSFFQLVMEKHGSGMDLFEFIDRKPKMDEKLASYIFRQMVSAVHYLHSLGILHRDIKDENVIINEVFHVKLIDFGSAAFMSPGRVFSTFYGTVEYCSPEVLQGNSYSGPELEIWALGVTLFVLIFGENPFYDVEETIKGEFSIPKPVSSQLLTLVNGMLEKDVNLRWNIDKVYLDPWVNLPVDPECYLFQNVVRCDDCDAYPAKYVSEYLKGELGRGDDDEDRTVASSNSFCSLHTIENLEESCVQFQDSVNLDDCKRCEPSESFMFSSTPRRASATKAGGCVSTDANSADTEARKRYSLDLNTLKKLCESDQVRERTGFDPSIHIQVISNKPSVDDFENYWDAEDEQYDQDSI